MDESLPDMIPDWHVIQIFVKEIFKSCTHSFDLLPHSTIKDMKIQVMERSGIPVSEQILMIGNHRIHELSDETLIAKTVIVRYVEPQHKLININTIHLLDQRLVRANQIKETSVEGEKETRNEKERREQEGNNIELDLDSIRLQVRDDYNRWAIVYDDNINPTRDLEGESLRKLITQLQETHSSPIKRVLEIGCGTGKNSGFFLDANHFPSLYSTSESSTIMTTTFNHLGVDLSPEMLSRSKQRFPFGNFVIGDITQSWNHFLSSSSGVVKDDNGALSSSSLFDLVAFSLVLEHIEDLNHIFAEASRVLSKYGYVYIGELHPIKQYLGSKARFDSDKSKAQGQEEGQEAEDKGEESSATSAKTTVVPCFTHHLTDFLHAAETHGLHVVKIEEFFDDDSKLTANSMVNGKKVPRILALLLQKKM